MSNTHKTHTKTDKNDKNFVEHVEKSTHVIEHDLANIDNTEDKVHDLDALLKNPNKKK